MTTITKQYRIGDVKDAVNKLRAEKAIELTERMAKILGMSVSGFSRALTVKTGDVLGVEAERILKEYLESDKLQKSSIVTKELIEEAIREVNKFLDRPFFKNVTISDFRVLLKETRELKSSDEKKVILEMLEKDFPKAMNESPYVIIGCCSSEKTLTTEAEEVYVEAMNIYSDIC